MALRTTGRQLIIEVDGAHETRQAADAHYEDCLVLRFCDEEVERDMQSVVDRIVAAVAQMDCPRLPRRRRGAGG